MFRGRYVHTIDAKNRMSLPAHFRNELTRRGDRPPILTNGHLCLDLFAGEDWDVYEQRIVAIADVDPAAQEFVRMRVSGATECPIDRQGRILVPPHLRVHAGLEREVTVAGVGPRIELWDRARFEASLNNAQAHYPETAMAVASRLSR
jgi:MraZ protein